MSIQQKGMRQIKPYGNIITVLFFLALGVFATHGIITEPINFPLFSRSFFNALFVVAVSLFCAVAFFCDYYEYTDEYLKIQILWLKCIISLKSIDGFTPYLPGTYAVVVGKKTYMMLLCFSWFSRKQIKEFAITLKEKNPDCSVVDSLWK